MRLGIVGGLIVAFGPSLAFSSDYDVSASDSFADAIAAANRNTDGDTFEISVSGAHGDSGTISKKASITGDTTAELTGNLTFSGSDMDSEINNMKFGAGQGSAITNGIMPEGNAQNLALNGVTFSQRVTGGFGGAVFNIGNMTIGQNSVFENNKADYGGAIYNAGTSKTLKIYDSRFSQNTSSSSGGAINNGGTLEINNSVFDANRSSAYYGGALYASGDTVLKNVNFDGNSAVYGGGIMNFNNMVIGGNSSFTNNKASAGGAVFTLGTLTLDTAEGNILFRGNEASDVSEGGADIYLNTGGNVEVNIRGDANVLLMDGGFAGTGLINKTGANTLIFGENADNSLFHGEFIQSAGTTEIYADNFFAGNNTVTDGAVLHFMREAEVNNLQLKTGGHLDLRRSGPFTANTLTINELISDGSAVVSLQTDGTTSDLLKIKDSAEGKITLDINAVGSAPTQKKLEVVNVEEADSKAEFKLAGNKVDIGAYEYGLIHDTDTNWYLETEGSLTRTAKSVEGIPSLHLSIVNAGMNELRKRLGDLRSDNPDTSAGVWMRGYGKHLRVHEKMGARMGLLGIEGGFDIAANLLGGKTYFGILGGYLSSDNIRVFQNNASDAKGHTRTPVAGLYASWLGKDKKWFVDLTARHFWVHSDLDNIRDNNALNGYDVKRNFWAFTAETGRQFDLPAPEIMNNGTARIAVEPKLELRYAEGNGKKFKTDTGGTGYVDKTRSLVSRFNVQTSYLPQGKKSTWKLFVELGVFNEWIGKTKVNFAGTDLTTSDLSGLGVETSLGFNAAISEDSYLYSAMTLEAGHTSTSYMFNAGLRVTF